MLCIWPLFVKRRESSEGCKARKHYNQKIVFENYSSYNEETVQSSVKNSQGS